jgi:hypothetical protein
MSPTDLTAILAGVTALIGSIAIPLWLARRKERGDLDMADVTSWQGLNSALRGQLDETEQRYRTQIADIRTEYNAQLKSARDRISELEQEVRTLQRLISPGRSQ